MSEFRDFARFVVRAWITVGWLIVIPLWVAKGMPL